MNVPLSVPTPRYEMRRRLATRLFRRLQPGSFLEAGCGWGELLPVLSELGYHGVGVEPSEASRQQALTRTNSIRERVSVVPTIEDVAEEFDYLLAFEVLEHLEDDRDEFHKWCRHLKPGGISVISVPAHMNRWSGSDVAVGHVRRYERDGIIDLHNVVGLEVMELWSYGFPVTAVTSRIREWGFVPALTGSNEERTAASAGVSHSFVGKPSRVARALMMAVGALSDTVQRPFLRTDLGDGYFVIARKE